MESPTKSATHCQVSTLGVGGDSLLEKSFNYFDKLIHSGLIATAYDLYISPN